MRQLFNVIALRESTGNTGDHNLIFRRIRKYAIRFSARCEIIGRQNDTWTRFDEWFLLWWHRSQIVLYKIHRNLSVKLGSDESQIFSTIFSDISNIFKRFFFWYFGVNLALCRSTKTDLNRSTIVISHETPYTEEEINRIICPTNSEHRRIIVHNTPRFAWTDSWIELIVCIKCIELYIVWRISAIHGVWVDSNEFENN